MNTSNPVLDHTYNQYDVFFARGHGVDKNPGNEYYRTLINTHSEDYVNGSSENKKEIANSIVYAIQSQGGRFLYRPKRPLFSSCKGPWKELSVRPLLKKIKQSLRDDLQNRAKTKGEEEQNTSEQEEEGCADHQNNTIDHHHQSQLILQQPQISSSNFAANFEGQGLEDMTSNFRGISISKIFEEGAEVVERSTGAPRMPSNVSSISVQRLMNSSIDTFENF
jgi:hypothetical protein